jgi:hypothetical protein
MTPIVPMEYPEAKPETNKHQLRTVRLTPDEFLKLREGISGAHHFQMAFNALLLLHKRQFDKYQRNVFEVVPDSVSAGMVALAVITNRENRAEPDPDEPVTVRINDLDISTFRDELENIAALTMPDLVVEMGNAIDGLPGLNAIYEEGHYDVQSFARMAAVTWEAGRRYGVMQSLAIITASLEETKAATMLALDAALNDTLELPAAEESKQMPLDLQPAESDGTLSDEEAEEQPRKPDVN